MATICLPHISPPNTTSCRQTSFQEFPYLTNGSPSFPPNRHIHIAAFPYFALKKIYPFFTPATALSVDTKYHVDYLNRFERNDPYLYIITLPKEFKDKFIEADPDGIYIPYSA